MNRLFSPSNRYHKDEYLRHNIICGLSTKFVKVDLLILHFLIFSNCFLMIFCDIYIFKFVL
jgi:hypothetical protein